MDLRVHVIRQLEERRSPEQIAGHLRHHGQVLRVSHETIYAYVFGPDGQSEELAPFYYIDERGGIRELDARRVGLVFRRIGRSTSGLPTSDRVRHLVDGATI